jgi:alpha-L-fucosidase
VKAEFIRKMAVIDPMMRSPLLRCSIVAALLCSLYRAAAADPPGGDIRLPATDYHWKTTRDYVEEKPLPEYRHASAPAWEAFRDIKYGVRIHWGLYSIAGNKPGESWPFLEMSFAEKQAYQQLYKTWNPQGFNAEEWMTLFAGCGLKMFAFTAKHHEGFSMFDTLTRVKRRVNWTAPGGPALEDCDLAYSILETPFQRDVVKELCDAAHRHGIKIDLYFSHPDWYDADFRPYGYHPAATPGLTNQVELYGNASVATRRRAIYTTSPDPTPEEEARMMARHRQQLTELLTRYGPIDMLCLDNWLGRKNWPQMRDTILELRRLQPDVMLRARGIGNYGDYYTPEGFTPGGKENTDMPWFVIFPLGTSFSYEADPARHKGGGWIVKQLVDIVAKGGNFMVGIGPDRNGRFHPTAIENLHEAGAWLNVNGEAIYATRPRPGELWKEGDALRFTRSKDQQTAYALSLVWPGTSLTLRSLQPKPGSRVFLLGYERPLAWSYAAATGLRIQLPAELQNEASRPCRFVYCFKFEQ